MTEENGILMQETVESWKENQKNNFPAQYSKVYKKYAIDMMKYDFMIKKMTLLISKTGNMKENR